VGAKWGKISLFRDFKKLLDSGHQNSYSKHHRQLQQMTMKLEGHKALMTELRNSQKNLVRKTAERDDLADLTDVRIILKLVVDMMIWTGFM
jgi:hypothetical protein